jgi:hypothetical protein
MSNDAIGIVGTDGYTPLYQENAAWRQWSIEEIYRGEEGLNKFIPKVKDWVCEPETGKMWRVANLDLVTYIPELVPINIFQDVTVNQIIAELNAVMTRIEETRTAAETAAVAGMAVKRNNGTIMVAAETAVGNKTTAVAAVTTRTIINNSKVVADSSSNKAAVIHH